MAKQTISTTDRRTTCFKCLADCRAKGAADKERKERERAAREQAANPPAIPAT